MVEQFELLYLKVRVKKYKIAFKRKFHRDATIDDLKKCMENDDCPSDSCACASDDIGSTDEKNCLDNDDEAMDLATDSGSHQYGCVWCIVFILIFITALFKWSF